MASVLFVGTLISVYLWELSFHNKFIGFVMVFIRSFSIGRKLKSWAVIVGVLLCPTLIIISLMFGLDAQIVNALFVRPDYSCVTDDDCIERTEEIAPHRGAMFCINRDSPSPYIPLVGRYIEYLPRFVRDAYASTVFRNCNCKKGRCNSFLWRGS